jgi:hypothetical protein
MRRQTDNHVRMKIDAGFGSTPLDQFRTIRWGGDMSGDMRRIVRLADPLEDTGCRTGSISDAT